MKLDRNLNSNGIGKYALIKLREAQAVRPLRHLAPSEKDDPNLLAVSRTAVDYGDSHETDFFVIRLKDKYAAPALAAYAMAAWADDQEYATEILTLARTAAEHPSKTRPT